MKGCGNGSIREIVTPKIVSTLMEYSGVVGVSVVRDFHRTMIGRADKGLIITTGNFSRDAKSEAIRDGAPAIDLIDGQELTSLLKQYELGVKTVMVEKVLVDVEWFGEI